MRKSAVRYVLIAALPLTYFACSGDDSTMPTTGSTVSGQGGSSDATGTAGSAGSKGGSGGSASGGSAGSAGSAGKGGSGGSAGSAGSGGTGGTAGTGGSAGQDGGDGSAGTDGGVTDSRVFGDATTVTTDGGEGTRCATVNKGGGSSPLISDFEDGLMIKVGDGHGAAGNWANFGGGTLAAAAGGNPGQALHLSFANDAAPAFLTFGAPLATCYDATAYTGLSFDIKGACGGADNIRVNLATPVTTRATAGACAVDASTCGDAYGVNVTAPVDWMKISHPWADFMQRSFGATGPVGYMPQSRIIEIDIGTNASVASCDLWIDNVAFTQ